MLARMGCSIALCVVLGPAASLPAKTLDFEFLKVDNNIAMNFSPLYIEDGFMLINAGAGPFAWYGTQHGDFAGSTGMYSSAPGSTITLVTTSGRPMRLKRIDLAPLKAGQGPVTVTFSAINQKNQFVSQTVTHSGTSGFTTFDLGDTFKNVDFVQWTQSAVGHQFDNIVVQNAPEPGSAVLGAFIGLIAMPLVMGRWNRETPEVA